jgi:hypothetical protein
MPNATSIQLDLLFPIKKESLLGFREVIHATTRSNKKYPITNENNSTGVIAVDYVKY